MPAIKVTVPWRLYSCSRVAKRASSGFWLLLAAARIAQEAKRRSGCHLLRREAGYSRHHNDGTRFAREGRVHARTSAAE
jgi:hypothetical protein